ncbi:MAG: isoprenylcysteine carboxylmethyltransferase family protein [bacterium]
MIAYLENIFNFCLENWSIIVPLVFFSLYIYWVSPEDGRNWIKNYPLPIIFFLVMLIRGLVPTIFSLKAQAHVTLPSILGLVNSIFVSIFMGIVVFSYIIRSTPKKQAQGVLERFYPVFVVGFHLIGTSILSTNTKSNYVPTVYLIGLIFCVVGITLNIASLWQLKNSFSVMVEVRKLINTGAYRFIRHPLYTGELTHLLGVCMLFNNRFSYSFFIVVSIMQLSRAKLEERKLSMHLPEYRVYKQNTGFIFPRLGTLWAQRKGREGLV